MDGANLNKIALLVCAKREATGCCKAINFEQTGGGQTNRGQGGLRRRRREKPRAAAASDQTREFVLTLSGGVTVCRQLNDREKKEKQTIPTGDDAILSVSIETGTLL